MEEKKNGCHFLLIVITIESSLKIQKSRMFLRIGIITLLIFLHQVIRCDTEVKN